MRRLTLISILAVTVILCNPLFGQWSRTLIADGYDLAISVDPQDLNGDSRLDLVVTDYLGSRIVLYLNNYPVYEEFIIDDTRSNPTFAYCADVDGDDTLDIIATFPHQRKVAWYENNHPNWTYHLISDSTDWGDWLSIADFNNDGRPDIATGPSYGTYLGDLVWYENQDPVWPEHIIESTGDQYATLLEYDLDQDGLMDMIAPVLNQDEFVWFKNEDSGITWTNYIVDSSVLAPFGPGCADLNKDGAPDLLLASASDSKVYWYENHDPIWNRYFIDDDLIDAKVPVPFDVNDDGDMDVVINSTEGDAVLWYENNNLVWTKHIIDLTLDAPRMFSLADIDGDEVEDLVVPGWSGIVWYKNPYTTVAYGDSLSVLSHFLYPDDDSLIITAELINPEEHSTSIWSLVQGVNTEYKDTVILYDDGINGDAVAGDDLFTGTFVSSELQEDWYTAYLYTEDLDEDLIVGSPLIEKFTTAGPIIVDSLSMVNGDLLPGQTIRFDVTIKNMSSAISLSDLVVTATTADTNASISLFNIKEYGDIGPGESVTNSGDFYMTILGTCPEDHDIKVDLSIAQEDIAYWEDYFILHVGTVGIVDIPNEFNLDQNFPNPLNPTTTIGYQLPRDSEVELTIYDITGRKIETLVSEHKPAGYHTINWNASPYPSGIYLYRLKAGDFIDTKKMVLMK